MGLSVLIISFIILGSCLDLSSDPCGSFPRGLKVELLHLKRSDTGLSCLGPSSISPFALANLRKGNSLKIESSMRT